MTVAVNAAHSDLAYIELHPTGRNAGIHRIGPGAYQWIHTYMDEFSSPDYEFGGFRLDTAQQVLISCTGEPLPLPSRAFATLRYLVERSGEIVDKSAIMAAVWPKTVVAENNLSQCILALRKALGDSPIERRFGLTVPGRGYKFVAAVSVVPRGRTVPAAGPARPIPSVTARSSFQRHWLAAAVIGALVAVGAVAWLWRARAQPVTVPAEYEQLTDVTDTATAPVLSPDGHMLAFIRGGGPYRGTGQIWLKVLPNGEPVQLSNAPGPVWAPAFTPDSAKVLFTTIDPKLGSWDTWSVPVTGGGEPTKLLPNALALSYIGPREVMYSEFDVGLHAGLVTSLDDRSVHRNIYAPIHEHGMARFSYLSPDRRSVLVSEMAASDGFGRCRLVPFDGRTAGYAVGPLDGGCISAAWSPDGEWMYFSSSANGVNHLWRQRFPNGEIEQITFGPNEEQTVFATPDGHALLTAIGRTQSSLWIHNGNGEHVLTTEGRVSSPWLSADARHVYFLTVRGEEPGRSLARMDIGTGSQESLLPGFDIIQFDVSPDERAGGVCDPSQKACPRSGWPHWIVSLRPGCSLAVAMSRRLVVDMFSSGTSVSTTITCTESRRTVAVARNWCRIRLSSSTPSRRMVRACSHPSGRRQSYRRMGNSGGQRQPGASDQPGVFTVSLVAGWPNSLCRSQYSGTSCTGGIDRRTAYRAG